MKLHNKFVLEKREEKKRGRKVCSLRRVSKLHLTFPLISVCNSYINSLHVFSSINHLRASPFHSAVWQAAWCRAVQAGWLRASELKRICALSRCGAPLTVFPRYSFHPRLDLLTSCNVSHHAIRSKGQSVFCSCACTFTLNTQHDHHGRPRGPAPGRVGGLPRCNCIAAAVRSRNQSIR